MLKFIVILTNLVIISFISLLIDQEINVEMEVPQEVQAGSEFQVDLSISKGDIETFSRFIQDLPYGLTATRINTANADFSFEDQRIRFIWLKLPSDQKFTVSYSIHVHERLKGTFSLSGEFSYIEENERKSMNVYGGHEIRINPKPGIPEDDLVHIDDFEQEILPLISNEKAKGELTVVRKDPYMSGAHEITVELEVKKNDLDRFAKIEEFVPEGFRAVAGETGDAIFSFNQGMIKYLWMNLPEEPVFTVSYKLIPDPGKSIDDLNLSGSFSYISDNESKTIAIVEKNADLAENNTVTNAPDVRDEKPEKEEQIDYRPDRTEVKLNEDVKKHEPELVEDVLPKNREFVLRYQNGTYYRVQLAAGHKSVDIEKYFKKRHINDSVKMEFHEGWRKYTVGSFDVYKEARDYRVYVWNHTPVKDAFVAAYNNGRRITVQEALMISNQDWYK